MRSLEELDHYDVLEVARDAADDEIERAYRLLAAAYADDSLAMYSMFDFDEASSLRARIDEAFQVLSDPEARRAYDARQECLELCAAEEAEPVMLAPLAETTLARPLDEPRPREIPTFDRMADEEVNEEGAEASWNGARLRRARLMRGIEVEDVAADTKINPAYLRFLEEERFDDLPAIVYVRGFVMAYARFLGLDAQRVSRDYVTRYEEHRRTRPRSRLPGRR